MKSDLTQWLNNLANYAQRQPRRVAVLGNETQLNYGELEGEISALMRQLQAANIVQGTYIAVCLDRSPHAIVAFLAILRLGAVYLPIDPQYLAARLQMILDCKPSALITTSKLETGLGEFRCTTLKIDKSLPCGPDKKTQTPALMPDDAPAYLLFTSGSSGVPRGVVVSRGALVRYANTIGDALGLSSSDVYLHSASFSFSASIRQLVAPLGVGATIVIAGESALRNPVELLDQMNRCGVTVWDTVPSPWRVVEQTLSKIGPGSKDVTISNQLRLVTLTGEPLQWELVRAWRGHLGNKVEIVNLYSQTETAGTVAMYPIPAGDIPKTGAVPLGTPLADTRILLRNEKNCPPPPGQEGEIYVANDRLAEGYLGAGQLSAGNFLAGTEVDCDYKRVYRTGDFAFIDSEGLLIPAGRHDHRVKIRGFRVDLLEVEAALLSDPLIRQAVALADPPSRLLAYAVAVNNRPLDTASVRKRLSTLLPEYAVPAKITTVAALPLLASGKLDRQALALLPTLDSPPLEEAPVTSNPIDPDLVHIWEQTLGYRETLPDHDFFEQGGDSLTAISLFLEIESVFGVRLPPSTLFTVGTLGGLAHLIKNGEENQEPAAVTCWREGGKLPPLFLVHTIAVHVPHLKKLVALLDPELPVFALEPIKNTDAIGRELNVDSLVKKYTREIRRVHPNGTFSLGGWSIGGFMAFCVAVEFESSGDPPAALMLIDASSASLRPQIRQYEARNLPRFFKYLRRRLKREFEALRLSPAQQWERFVWIYNETRRKLRTLSQRDRNYRLPARLHRDFSRVVDQYQPQPYHGPVTLFRSDQKTVDEKLDHDMGWGEYVSGKLDVVRMPGDHNSMVIEPQNMKMLASHMMQIIKQAASKTTDRSTKSVVENAILDKFLLESSKLSGQLFIERAPWNNMTTPDAIRHFAYGICDDNPLWLDQEYANNSCRGALQAPPAFLISARYPILHGAPIDVPLISLLRDIEFTWERRIPEGEQLHSSTSQGDVREIVDPGGHRRIYVEAHTRYWNGEEQLLGRARSTVVRMLNQGSFKIDGWEAHHYSADELERIEGAIHAEARTGGRRLGTNDYSPGTRLPEIVRGPLNIGDMVCWHAAVGPSYRPGPLGYKDTLETPQFRVTNPLTGWPIKYMLQHEDVHLAHQRGMPAPFDNGVMRFAWVSPLITNWMGDHGFLARLHITIHLPVLYGDTCWYSGEVSSVAREGDFDRVTIRISGANQRGTISTSGSADVLFPVQGV